MPEKRKYNKSTGRDYKSDYAKFHSSEKAKKERASRNAARRKLMKQGRVRKGDQNDIDHVNGNPKDNSPGNLKVMHKSKNRAKK